MANAADASGNGNTGTYIGSPTLGTTGLLTGDANTAVTFASATDQHAESDTTFGPTTYGAFTLECLIKASSLASFAHLCGFSIPGPPDALYLYSDGSGKVALNWQGVSTHNLVSASTVSTATIYHVAVTYDGSTFTLYLDGASDATASSSDSPVLTTGQAFYAGNDGFGTGDGFDGVLDEVAFYTTALSGARVAVHSAAVSGGGYSAAVLADSPVLYWRLGDSALSSYQFQIGSSTFGAGTGDVYLDHQGIDGLGVPDAKTQDVTYATRDGAYGNPDYTAMRLITIPVLIRAANETTALNDLKALETAWAPVTTDTTLTMSLPGWGTFTATGRPRGIKADLTHERQGVVHALLRFDCPDPELVF